MELKYFKLVTNIKIYLIKSQINIYSLTKINRKKQKLHFFYDKFQTLTYINQNPKFKSNVER